MARRAGKTISCLGWIALIGSAAQAFAGTYIDRDGVRHVWRITGTNVLLWDGRPYVPFGGMYGARYFFGASEETFDRDRSLLATIRSHGITDLYLNPPGLVATPMMQRVVDLLETLGFRYGIQLSCPPAGTMPGYEIRSDLLLRHVRERGAIRMEAAGRHRGLYVVVAAQTGDLLASGPVAASQGGFDVPVPSCPRGGCFVKVIPERSIGWITETQCRVVTDYIRQLRLGGGLRFILDPIGNEYCPPRHFLPSGSDWRGEFSRYLKNRYGDVKQQARAWGLSRSRPSDFDQSARLIPLIAGGKESAWPHVGYALDDVSGQVFTVEMSVSRMWADMCEAREIALRDRLNQVCDDIKKVCDVPVVMKRHHESTRLWINRRKEGGLDGLGMESYGTGDELGYFNGAATYADVAQAARPMWCLVTEHNSTHWENRHIAYRTREQMYADLNLLLGLGAKGIFIFGLSLAGTDGDKQWTTFELVNDPRQLEWLATFAAAARARIGWIARQPQTAFYYPPQNTDAKAFAAGDMTDYGLSGAWQGALSILPLGPLRWVAPVFYPDAPGTILYSPRLSQWPCFRSELQELGSLKDQKRAVAVPLTHPLKLSPWLAERYSKPPAEPVALRVWQAIGGVEAVAWSDDTGRPRIALRSTGAERSIRISSTKAFTAELHLPGEVKGSHRNLPVIVSLPRADRHRQSFMLHNPSFGVNGAHFECEVEDSPQAVEITGIPTESLRIEEVSPSGKEINDGG